MDALIRAASLAPSRMRLSETRAGLPMPTAPGLARELLEQQRVNAARQEIEAKVRAETQLQLQELYQAERERARQDGLAEARSAAADELQKSREQLRTRLDAAMAALEIAHDAVLRRLEASVGEVSFAAVCHFVGRHLAGEDFVRAMVAQTCAPLRAETATARLHPRDVALLEQFLEGDVLRIQSIGLKLEADASLTLGGCVVEAASGTFDGGLENQLRRLHAALKVPHDTRESERIADAMSFQDVR
jgi:flagellar assembly protein FliH